MAFTMHTGLFRLWLVLAVVWGAGMGWYQFQQSRDASHHELNIQFTQDSGIHVQADTPEDNNQLLKRWLWVLLPPLAMLLIIPVGGWIGSGFRKGQ